MVNFHIPGRRFQRDINEQLYVNECLHNNDYIVEAPMFNDKCNVINVGTQFK